MRRILWIVLGCVGVGLGAVGAVLPLLPAFPFLLLAAFSFAKSSQRLHTWFINTSLYKKNLESYVQHRAMTWRTKRRIMLTVTVLMAFGFVMMMVKGLYIPCAILAGVWVFHILYFIFGVKTLEEPPTGWPTFKIEKSNSPGPSTSGELPLWEKPMSVV